MLVTAAFECWHHGDLLPFFMLFSKCFYIFCMCVTFIIFLRKERMLQTFFCFLGLCLTLSADNSPWYEEQENSSTLYYAVSSDKWTNVKIQLMSWRTHWPLLPPEHPPPCSGPRTGRREACGSVADNQQFNTFAKEKATFHLGQSLLGMWSQSQGGPQPKGPRATSCV